MKGSVSSHSKKSKFGLRREANCIFFALAIMVVIGFAYFAFQKVIVAKGSSAWDYFEVERDFLEEYANLPDSEGYAYWVDQDGDIEDPRLFSVYQANFILWVGGIESQHPSEKNKMMIEDAADALLNHLYKGEGEWLEWVNLESDQVQEFFWNPRSEAHIAYALLEAYRILEDERYATVANATLNAQRQKNPTPPITAEYTEGLDIGFRFPEHMGHLMQTQIEGNVEGEAYALAIDRYYRGVFAKEPNETDGGYLFVHGMATLDKLLYAYISENEEAREEASALYEIYKNQGHGDEVVFEDNVSEAADNGRDYYDKRLSMALILWSQTEDEAYKEDALNMWSDVLRFWDDSYPYGFFVNLAQDRKTCFTINQPAMLMDLTAPEIISIENEQKFWWNHQVRILVRDPDYKWLDHDMRGIGLDLKSVHLEVPYGVQYGQVKTFAADSSCEDCVILEFNYLLFKHGEVGVGLSDEFNNRAYVTFDSEAGIFWGEWRGWNAWSLFYYLANLLVLIFLLAFLYSKISTRRLLKKRQKSDLKKRVH